MAEVFANTAVLVSSSIQTYPIGKGYNVKLAALHVRSLSIQRKHSHCHGDSNNSLFLVVIYQLRPEGWELITLIRIILKASFEILQANGDWVAKMCFPPLSRRIEKIKAQKSLMVVPLILQSNVPLLWDSYKMWGHMKSFFT